MKMIALSAASWIGESLECEWDRDRLIPIDMQMPLYRAGNAGQAVDFVAITGPDDGIGMKDRGPEPGLCCQWECLSWKLVSRGG